MNLIKLENGIAVLDAERAVEIAFIDDKIKKLKAVLDEKKAQLLSEMESKNIYKLETPELSVTYIAPTNREQFDSKNFRKSYPDLYDEFCRFIPVNASIRLKTK